MTKIAAALGGRYVVPIVILSVAISLTGNLPAQAQTDNPAPSSANITPTPDPPVSSDSGKSSKPTSKTKQDKPDDANTQPQKPKRGSFIFAPIPISSPAFGSGMLLIPGYVFQFDPNDKVSPPSWVGAAGAFTNNGTRALVLGGRLYLKENKYQTTFAVGTGRANLDFFGIGRIPGRDAVSVPLRMSGSFFFVEAMKNIGRNIFIGPRYQFRHLSAGIDGPHQIGGFEVPSIDVRANSAALGFHVQRDLRDSTFYPTKGSLFDFTADFFAPAFGSRREYQTYKISYNGFRELAERQVLGYRLMACSANGSVPFYDLCLFGSNSDIRGYTTGQFQNRRMFATQAEYRYEWRKRLGFVAFGGVGEVQRTWGDFRSDQLLPAAGAGLRFTLEKKSHINYRLDFAFGREGHSLSIGVAEAF